MPSSRATAHKDGGTSFISQVRELETQLTVAVTRAASLNPLLDLIDIALKAQSAADCSKAIYSLYRVFVLIFHSGKWGLAGDATGETKVVRTWIWERFGGYVDFLLGLLKDEEKLLRTSALEILVSFQRHLSTMFSTRTNPQFHVSHFRKIVSALLLCPPSKRKQVQDDGVLDPDVRDLFIEKWFSVHDDVRWFFLRDASTIMKASSSVGIAANLLSILERLTTFPTEPSELNSWWVEELGREPRRHRSSGADSEMDSSPSDEDEDKDKDVAEADDWRQFFDDEVTATPKASIKRVPTRRGKMSLHQSLHLLPCHRAVFTSAWLTLLPKVSITRDSTLSIRVLNVMHRGVMPHLTRPVLVLDWVGACVDFGGPIALLALNTLFILMTEYNLDHPSFYTSLYAFLDRDVLHLQYRARFFRMAETFLSSSHLPATLLASFVKKLSRLSLNAPPAAIITIVPFTYNILKRHPALMVMIHRLDDPDSEGTDDPYVVGEPNPNLTHALESSLWELISHKHHYHPAVSTLACLFEEAFTKPSYALEDFLDHTYSTMITTETTRKIRKEVPLAAIPKTRLFTASQEEGEDAADPVANLWVMYA